MNSLENLPVFLALAGRKVVLAGNGEPAAWKVELIAATGAEIQLFAPAPAQKLYEAAQRAGVAIEPRAWREADLNGALVAVLEAGTTSRLSGSAPPRARPALS